MPARETPLINGYYYHVFNRCVSDLEMFCDDRSFRRMQFTLEYYLWSKQALRLSVYLGKSIEVRTELRKEWMAKPRGVELLAYCLMPNHFHLLLKQTADDGIKDYLTRIQNSFAHYYNTRNKRNGPLFASRYKSVLIESDNQLIHVSRYIHLNPVTAYLVKTVDLLHDYPWSSWNEYCNQPVMFPICTSKQVMEHFRDIDEYTRFLKSDADFQRELKSMQKLLLDESLSHGK